MGLLNEGQQLNVSEQRRLPVDNVGTDALTPITGETVQLQYYNSGVLTNDAGQAAGTIVVAKLAYRNVKNALGDVEATYNDTSLTFTSTALTTEVPFPHITAEQNDQNTGLSKAQAITAGFSNGEYCVDYRTGAIYGVKASTQTSLTSTSYKVEASTSGGGGISSDVNVTKIGGTTVTAANSDILIPTVLTGGSKTVTTAGTAEALGTTLATKSIYIRAKASNTSFVCVGDSSVDEATNQQIVLYANDSVTLDIANRMTVYVDADVNGEGVDYLAMS